MLNTLPLILEKAQNIIPHLTKRSEWEQVKAQFLGPQGSLTEILKKMGTLPAPERPIAGKKINEIKQVIEQLLSNNLSTIENLEINAKLGPAIDPTLPSTEGHSGKRHPLSIIKNKAYDILHSLGFTMADGCEVETDWACFDALNVPKHHPSRAEKDTYYFPDTTDFKHTPLSENEQRLLRTHTSSVQIRTLLTEKPPLKIASIGRCFRRDTADATHSANFHQIEILHVDQTATIKDLKAVLDYFLKAFFGQKIQVRFRPSFFPFTEPSFEVDMIAPDLGKLSNQWIEILGCGRVNPAVFEAVNLDASQWAGYAAGIGLERLAMLSYGIDDIRHFYQNDLRFLL